MTKALQISCQIMGSATIEFNVTGMTEEEIWNGIKEDNISFDIIDEDVRQRNEEGIGWHSIGSCRASADLELDYFESKFGNHRHSEETNDMMDQ